MSSSLTIFVRHELEPELLVELVAAGAAVVVGPQAPSCGVAIAGVTLTRQCPRCAALDRELASRASRVSLELFGRARAARDRRHRRP